jgi:hypothetical protein
MEAVYRGHPGRVTARTWKPDTGELGLVVFAYEGEGHWWLWDTVTLCGADLEGLVINGEGLSTPTGSGAGG